MALDQQGQGQLILAQNQYAFIQDVTKGPVQVYAGPHSGALSQSDRPVVFNPATGAFDAVSVSQAVKQNPLVPEGYYVVLENPATKDSNLHFPGRSGNNPVDLQIGRKIVISGPTSFALWPGQNAKVVEGHKLRSNQYVIVRVYNAEQANENPIDAKVSEELDSRKKLENGQLFVIKGTEVSFFIPSSGYEVLEQDGQYIQEALTLERLEYAILLDENGNKRYEIGPQVVFPKATEKFIRKSGDEGRGSLKFKAIELNDQMGLYIKVIADYTDEKGNEHKAGDELFITGKDQRIYYPRPEQALIQYKDPESTFMRDKYYAIAIPKGEGRYVLDKTKGEINTVVGPQMFLPDPRNETIVRRVLNEHTVNLWYPKNTEAAEFNKVLRSLATGGGYVTETSLLGAVDSNTRSLNRMATSNRGIGASATAKDEGNDRMVRSGTYTPPPTLTLNTKYDGIPSIEVWTGYAVQIVSKNGERQVVLGPTTRLLAYDEKLEVLTLSSGKPKTTDLLKRDVYLRYENNLVSDVVNVITKDNVEMSLKVSYRVNFLTEHKEKWFSVENYVKFLTDHTRSLIKAEVKGFEIKDMNDKAAIIVRDAVLGKKQTDKTRQRLFTENGMVITDVEVLSLNILDPNIAQILKNAQQKVVQTTIALASEEQNMALAKRQLEIDLEVAKLKSGLVTEKEILARSEAEAHGKTMEIQQEIEADQRIAKAEMNLAYAESEAKVAEINLNRTKAAAEQQLAVEDKQVSFYERKQAAITPNLIEAMIKTGDQKMLTDMQTALAPIALHEQIGLAAVSERIFKDTPLETVLNNIGGNKVKGSKIPA